MNRNIKIAAVTVITIIVLLLGYRLLFIRTVNYNIAGIDIPATYNILTKKAVPIADYKGKTLLKTVLDQRSDKIGLAPNDVIAAQVRWALFAEWARSRNEYKGWESDPEVFKKANEEFQDKVPSNVTVVK